MKKQRETKNVEPLAKKGVMRNIEIAPVIQEVGTIHKKQTNLTKKGDLTMEANFTKFTGFDPKSVGGDVIKMMKYSLDTTLDSIAKIQEFNNRIVKDMIKTNKQIQADAENVLGELMESGNKGWGEYKKVVEKGFKQVEDLMQPAK